MNNDLKENPIRNVDLFITEKCNLSCKYCFHQKGRAGRSELQEMDIETTDKILSRLKELFPDGMGVNFFGGEPLLKPEIVLHAAEYANKLWDKTSFTISTNGTIFDEELFKKMRDLRISIQVSFDGDEYTQNLNRGNFELVRDNIKKMLVIHPDLSVRMTFTPETVGILMKNVEYIHNLGVTKIAHHATMEDDWTKDAVFEYNNQFTNMLHYRRYCLRTGIPLDLNYVEKNLKILNDEAPLDKNFCGAGKNYVAILPNGDVYPCHRAASSRIFKLGNIFKKENPITRGIFLGIDKYTVGCIAKCNASKTCHTCIITNYLVNNDLNQTLEKNHYCDICRIESEMCKGYLTTDATDKMERILKSMGMVIADIAEKINTLEEKDAKK